MRDGRANMTFLLLAVAAQAAAAAPGLAGMLAEGAITDAPVPVHMLESVMAGPFGKKCLFLPPRTGPGQGAGVSARGGERCGNTLPGSTGSQGGQQ